MILAGNFFFSCCSSVASTHLRNGQGTRQKGLRSALFPGGPLGHYLDRLFGVVAGAGPLYRTPALCLQHLYPGLGPLYARLLLLLHLPDEEAQPGPGNTFFVAGRHDHDEDPFRAF
jgi:hypothetical protein